MIRFSIVTVCFNAADIIEDTLRSIEHQTYPSIEHIIIDGSSKDKTVELCQKYRERCMGKDLDHEVIIISEPDCGIYDAMNKGIRKATGDYILFLNSGDQLAANDTLDIVASCVGEGETLPAVLYGDTDIINNEGIVVGRREKRPPQTLTWKKFKWGMLVCHQAFYARTDLAKETAYNLRYRYSSDVDWCIRIMKEAARRRLTIRNINTTTALFLDGGATTRHHQASLRERFRIMQHHYGIVTTTIVHLWFAAKKIF